MAHFFRMPDGGTDFDDSDNGSATDIYGKGKADVVAGTSSRPDVDLTTHFVIDF